MSANALNLVLNDLYGSSERLKVYYDFARSGISTAGAGSTYTGYLKNTWPSPNVGSSNLQIQTTSASTTAALASGEVTSFLTPSGSGNLTYANAILTGNPTISFEDTSFLISFSNSGAYSNGILLGALTGRLASVYGEDQWNYSGANFGVNSRGKLFFQAVGQNGPYVFTANNMELAQKNIVACSIGGGKVEISRFNYLNNTAESEKFPTATNEILDTSRLYIGTSPTFFRAVSRNAKTFSGYVDKLAIISGSLTRDDLFKIGSGFIAEYVSSMPVVSGVSTITGYQQTTLFNTGVTGRQAVIAGYVYLPSGFSFPTGTLRATTAVTLAEGDRYYKYTPFSNSFGSGFYKEELGYLDSSHVGSYDPVDESASGTLGLMAGVFSVSNYVATTGMSPLTTVAYPVYSSSGVTGYTDEITGYANTPMSQTVYVTGQWSSWLVPSGDSTEFKKDFIYYLEDRI